MPAGMPSVSLHGVVQSTPVVRIIYHPLLIAIGQGRHGGACLQLLITLREDIPAIPGSPGGQEWSRLCNPRLPSRKSRGFGSTAVVCCAAAVVTAASVDGVYTPCNDGHPCTMHCRKPVNEEPTRACSASTEPAGHCQWMAEMGGHDLLRRRPHLAVPRLSGSPGCHPWVRTA